MSENVPSAIRDSDAVDDGSTVGSASSRSSPGTVENQSDSWRIALLEQTLEQQNKDITNLTKAFESLQNAYVERMDKAETELKRNKDETESLNKRLLEKDHEISELRKKIQSSEVNAAKVTEVVEKGMQEHNRNQTVCFTARVAPSYQDIAPWATIVFKTVETNAGNGYNSSNGEFCAPRAGYYVFYSNILSQVGKCIETVIQVNGESRQCIYSGGTPAYQGPGGNMLVVHLKTGDTVRVAKHGPWGAKPFYIHHNWSTFSGFLLRSDS